MDRPPAAMLRPGHTVFSNGLHGDGWLEKGEVVRDPGKLDALAARQAGRIAQTFVAPTLIAGASQCGAVLAAFVARHLKLPAAFLNLEAEEVRFHRMFQPPPGQRVVLVDDLISTGHDARALVRGLQAAGHEVVGLSVWLARGSAALPAVPVARLWDAPFGSFPAQDCPLCRAGEAVRWQDVRE